MPASTTVAVSPSGSVEASPSVATVPTAQPATEPVIGTLEWVPAPTPAPVLHIGTPLVEPSTSSVAQSIVGDIERQAPTFSRCYGPEAYAQLAGEIEVRFTVLGPGRVGAVEIVRGLGDGAEACMTEQIHRWTLSTDGHAHARVTVTLTFSPAV